MSKKDVEKFLKSKNYEFEFIEMSDSSTVEIAANGLGVTTNEIAKTLAFIINDEPLVIVMSGDSKIDNKKFKSYFKKSTSMIPGEIVKDITNHPVGGVCPFGLKDNVKIYFDESLKMLETFYPAGGETNLAIKMSLNDLVKLTNPIWIDVTKIKEKSII